MATMNTSNLLSQNLDDAQLVERSLRGDTRAFGSIVERHQSLVCGLAYSACGNIHASEDLAQETFITAWRQLPTLREKNNLRGWLCGIARHVIHGFLRRQQRTPTAKAAELSEVAQPASEAPAPDENAINEQELAILWRTLQTLPANYREPMVLFYREHESVGAVAESLGITEDAVKQRLARGRVMLTEHVERLLGETLRRTAPTAAFTCCVLAALPLATTSATAAVAGTTLAKGSAGAKAFTFAAIQTLLSPLLGILAAWVGYKVSVDSARSEQERQLVKRFFRFVLAYGLVFSAVVLVLVFSGRWLARSHPVVLTSLTVGLAVINVLLVTGSILWARRQSNALLTHERNSDAGEPSPAGKWKVPFMEYRSRTSVFGLPLVHLRFGRKPGEVVKPVKAWFAVGDCAIGVIGAFGAMSIAPISMGGCAFGLLSIGGVATGIAGWGGIGIGVWMIGGLALGWQAFGGLAVGWQAASGGLAVAHDFAAGGVALAAHANDANARTMMDQSTFFPLANAAMNHLLWINLIWFLPMLLVWLNTRKIARQAGMPKNVA